MSALDSVLIATCGNELAGDDAFGPLMARALREAGIAGAEIVELGMNPTALLDRLSGRSALILVDAAEQPGLPAGRLMEFDWNPAGPAGRRSDRPLLRVERSVSTHGLSAADQLELAARLGLLPAVVRIVAVTAEATGMGDAPCRACLRQIRPAVERVRRLVRENLRPAARTRPRDRPHAATSPG